MIEKKGSLIGKSPGGPKRIVKERLSDKSTELTDLFLHHGANLYVFSYEKEGVKRHTLVDTGDISYSDWIIPTLIENNIDPENIERIIITHRHRDHCGLAYLLAAESGAKILAHSNFRGFVEGEISQEERRWLGNLDPSQLKKCDIEYLPQSGRSELISIGGVDFPSLVEPIRIGEAGRLEILGCPESTPTHSPDQIIVLYSPRSHSHTREGTYEDFRPTDDIICSGDLWLMRGPIFDWGLRNFSLHLRFGFYRIKNLLSGSTRRRDPRDQDSEAKEALKRGFSLIRVKPGHGEEFIGSRIIPNSLQADRDLLIKLGYSLNTDKSILKSKNLAPQIADIMKQAYVSFVDELLQWTEMGYGLSEISELLVRIYKEQTGGGSLVEEDRKERRERLKATLIRLKSDKAVSEELHQLAESTLSELKRVP